eukprot:m.19161 g.19161  ORF g.19161 m.19161 type:complete len:325 (+) comp8418_c0_seq2:4-978(+)
MRAFQLTANVCGVAATVCRSSGGGRVVSQVRSLAHFFSSYRNEGLQVNNNNTMKKMNSSSGIHNTWSYCSEQLPTAATTTLFVARRFAGHSKWANIKHQKGAADKKRALLFQKLTNGIAVAVKKGGSDDPNANPALKTAISAAKASDMPNNKIEQAIRVGSGAGKETKEILFEIAGPGGSQFLVFVEATSRETVRPELQRIVNKHGGSIGKDGSAMWAFSKQTEITVSLSEDADPEELALEVDAEDVHNGEEDGEFKLICGFEDGGRITSMLEEFEVPVLDVQPVYTITSAAAPSPTDLKAIKLLERKFEDVDDVSQVVVNLEE